ncbi:Cysteine proteinase inhibitor A [Tritrichomonas foetus]|uniref:Cysteine proteinase inhibitor A n=1 Tax=Tritrichomonas foetus TaxID=1144522 RepID=A0A1J4KT48_9EUKA|nr:Cysteine proteinase inhibitor A [Tritrichomonas foetus]|eukprot:OHT14056.1 Cysteine proteinase inhibitor A [Tritrichomonas foetus]
MEGGISPADVNDGPANQAVRLAIQRHNEESNDNLQFQKIINLSQQVVAGMRYRATIECTKDGATKQFDIDIWCKPGKDFPTNFEVQSFVAKE